MWMPFGTKTKAMRLGRALPTDCARADSGIIASSSGSAIAVPTPLRKVRLGIGVLINFLPPSSCPRFRAFNRSRFPIAAALAEGITLHHLGHERREAVIVPGDIANDLIDVTMVVRLQPASQRVGE